MSVPDIAQFTHKWRATDSNTLDSAKVVKRNRQPISCQSCRVRKLKCDRKRPCDACTKRNEAGSCVYGKASATNLSSTASNHLHDHQRSEMKTHDRLRHLEDLVRTMVDNGVPRLPGHVSSSTSLTDDAIQTQQATNRARHGGNFGLTHWSEMLQHLHELKNDILTPGESVEESIDTSEPDALFGAQRPPSITHVLKKHLPPRILVDRKVSQYFNARYLVLPVIHLSQFRRQYEKFWEDPPGANVMWTSIFFSICCLSSMLSRCLLLGNYSKPQLYVVEALSLFLQCRIASSLNAQRDVLLIFAVQSRLAYMMGYHRDGSHFPGRFPPFHVEMRRRVWSMMVQFDLLASFQLGLPNTIMPDSWDTQTPSNLLDSDFDEDSVELPPSRPETDVTQILYFAVKSRIINVYTKICRHSLSFAKDHSFAADVLPLDQQLREQVAQIPTALQIRPVGSSITDAAHEVMSRLNISFLWRKALCVLHRKHMADGNHNYIYDTCVESASSMCASLIDLYAEFEYGGAFAKEAWMLSSFTIVDFLFASMLLCLAMSLSRKRHLTAGGGLAEWLELDETKYVLQLLDKCQKLCADLASKTQEAGRVSQTLVAMLSRLRIHARAQASTSDQAEYQHRKRWTQGEQVIAFDAASGGSAQTPTTPGFPRVTAIQPGAHGLASSSGVPLSNDTTSESHSFLQPSRSGLWVGPFSHLMWDDSSGIEAINWSHLDQFTGFLSNDVAAEPFGNEAGATQTLLTDPGSMDYADWDSTPVFSLGARSRDPITGRAVAPNI